MIQVTQLFTSFLADPTVDAVALAIVGALVGVWLAAAWWTYADISRRSSSELARLLAAGWVLVSTPALLPLSLGAYLLVRPQQTVAERRAQRLFEAMAPSLNDGLCPSCTAAINPEWHRCPSCRAWLADACATCGQWSDVDLAVCPFCAHDKAMPASSSGPAVTAAMRAGASPALEPAFAGAGAGATLAAAAILADAGDLENADDTATTRIRLTRPRAGGLRSSSPGRRLVGNRGARVRRTEGAERSAGSRSAGA